MNLLNIAFAQDRPSGIIAAIDSFIPGGIANVFNLGLGIGAILALGTIIYAGILYSTAGDNSSKQGEAKKWIWAAVKGLALIALGVVLINIINPQATMIREIEIPKLVYDDLAPLSNIPRQPPPGGVGGAPGTFHPLPGAYITSAYGRRINPTRDGGVCHNHHGIDFSTGECGAPVRASATGIFNRGIDPNGYGVYASISGRGDGFISYYAHLSGFPPGLTSGTTVSQGDIIGFVGTTGNSTGCHLHFEIRNTATNLSENINSWFPNAESVLAAQTAPCR